METLQAGRIFISYRREENGWPARQLYEVLSERFGEERVFKDVDSIEPGDDFVERIQSAVTSCHVLLALIGRNWVAITDANGGRRLDDPGDFVRLEIETALERGVRVIPILIDDAQMPRAADLPPRMARLVRRHAIAINPVTFDTDRLLRTIEVTLREVEAETMHPRSAAIKQSAGPEITPEVKWSAPIPLAREQRRPKAERTGEPWFARHRRLLLIGGAAAVLVALVSGLLVWFPTVDQAQSQDPSSRASTPNLPRATPLSDNQLIVAAKTGNTWGLFLADADDDGRRDQLTSSSVNASSVNLSPDRASIIYRRYEAVASQSSLYVAAVTGGSGTVILKEIPGVCQPGITRPAWNPRDSSELAVVCKDPQGRQRLDLISLDGRLLRTIEVSATKLGDPTFSPDGSKLAFWAAKGGAHPDGGALYVAEQNGVVRALTESADGVDADPIWSPDGKTIAFRRNRSDDPKKPNGDIYSIPSEGGTAVPLIASDKIEQSPSLSPGGERLAYRVSKTESVHSLFRVWILDLRTQQRWPLWGDAASKALDQGAPMWSRR